MTAVMSNHLNFIVYFILTGRVHHHEYSVVHGRGSIYAIPRFLLCSACVNFHGLANDNV